MIFIFSSVHIRGMASLSLRVIATAMLMLVLFSFSSQARSSEYILENHTFSYRVALGEDSAKIMDIINLQDGRWAAPTSDIPNYGYTEDTYWFKVKLPSSASLGLGRYYYIIDYPVLDSVKFFLVSNNVIESRYETGDTVPYAQRPVKSNKFVFPVDLDGTEKTIYLHLDTEGTLQLPAKLLSEEEYHQQEFAFYLMEGILAGVIGIMLFYNLSLWYVFRTPEYLYYVLYGISVLTVQLTMLGLSFQFIWPNATWWNNAIIPASMLSSVIFILLFTNVFLNVRVDRPNLSNTIRFCCIGLSLFTLTSFFMAYELAIKIAMLSVILCLILLLITVVGALRYSFESARLYLISWFGVIAGAVALVLTKFGIIPINVITANSWQIGTGIEIALLSFALSLKIKAVTDARISAEEDAKIANILNAKHLEQYKAIYNNSLEGLFKIDLVKRSIIFNDSFAKMNGIEDMIDGSNDEIFIMQIMDRLKLGVCSVPVKNKRLRRDEEQVIHTTEDQDKWLAVKRRYLEDGAGSIVAIEGTIVDITDRKLKEKAELNLIEGLKTSDKIKNEFFSTISHELLTPLNGINGYLQLLKDQVNDNENLRGIESSSSDMLLMINRILNFSQLHAESLTVELVEFTLDSILNPLKEKYSNSCQAKYLDFEIKLEGPIPDLLVGDSRKIFQILDEFLSNALKFTPTGTIGLSIKVLEKEPISQDKPTGLSSVLFSVTDTGIGIDQEDRDKVFSLFSQADNSNTRRYGGVGLGLFLSKALCDMLGGELSLVSTPGEGSRFDFTIDLKIERIEAAVTDNDKQCLRQDDACLLVVEDNVVNQTIMRGILRSLGYQCRIAENGDVALAMLEEEKFHLIFMDCQMPVKDGFETTEIIRAKKGVKNNIPIIAVTANVMSGDRERCLSVGMNDFLQKPVKRDLIKGSINKWLRVGD